MKARQTRYTAYAGVYILVILAVLTAVNFLANRYDKSYDSTSNKQYSLSDQSIKVVKNLKGDLHITYFDDQSRFQGAHDLLDRYSNLSPKVHVAYIDPVKKPAEARAAGFSRDTTILVDSGVRKESAKSLTEEEITGAVIRSLKSGERNVCFVTGSGEHSLDDTTGGDGYAAEIEYFAECVSDGVQPARCPPKESAEAVRLMLALIAARERNGDKVAWISE